MSTKEKQERKTVTELSGGEIQALINAHAELRGKWIDDAGRERPFSFSKGRVGLMLGYNLQALRAAFEPYRDADERFRKEMDAEMPPEITDPQLISAEVTRRQKVYQEQFEDMWASKVKVELRPVRSTHLETEKHPIPFAVIDTLINFDLLIDDEEEEDEEPKTAEILPIVPRAAG